jgi:hypothetical protein
MIMSVDIAVFHLVATGILKAMDLFARRHQPPRYAASQVSPQWVVSLILLTELRCESFDPNYIRISGGFSEPLQLAVHTGAFAVLQSLPQSHTTILAFEGSSKLPFAIFHITVAITPSFMA